MKKTKNVQISFDRLFAKNLQFFLAKLVVLLVFNHSRAVTMELNNLREKEDYIE